jgi:dihydrofolate synthase/folylpolyglutamate synthase
MLAGAVAELKDGYRKLILVIGILGDKDFRRIISELVPLADQVIVTRPDYGRAMDLNRLAHEVRTFHKSVDVAESVSRAVVQAKEQAGPDDLILVTGSLYVVGEARAALVPPVGQVQELRGLKG